MGKDFDGCRALVTGSTRGIGFATACALLERGAHVAVNGRTPGSVDAALERLPDARHAVAAPGDLAAVLGCEAAVQVAVDALGGLDLLVNCAGVGVSASIEETDEPLFDRIMAVNLKGTWFCIRAALPALRESGGQVVSIASDAGLIGEAMLGAYCASKGGVVNMTRALALELAPAVRVNCICPGYVDTDMVRRDGIERAADPAAAERAIIEHAPLRRMATPAEIAQVVVFMASPAARFATGAAWQLDGGTTAGR